jgi:alpha-1,2-mannosyltransferase
MKATPQADSPSLPCPRTLPWETLGRAVLAVSLVAAFSIASYRALYGAGGSDFPEFYAAGRYVLEHGEIEPTAFLRYYWPSVDVAFAGLAWMPLPMASAVWNAIGCLSWIGLLMTIHRLLASWAASPIPRRAALAAGLLMLPLALNHLCLGAFHILMIWLMVAGLARVSRGHCWSGGMLLGLGVWIKLLPLLGVGYLVLKRKWLAAGVAVATAIVVDLALALPAFGPQRAWELHVQWWENQGRGAADRNLSDPGITEEDRITSQSLAVVLRRLLTRMGWEAFPGRNPVALANLSSQQLRMVYLGITGLVGLGIAFSCRRPGRSLDVSRWATEIALVTLGTLWFSPVVWSYHFTAATPALAAVAARRAVQPRVAWGTAALWLVAMGLFGWPLARSFGAVLWITFALGAILVWSPRKTEAGHGVTRLLSRGPHPRPLSRNGRGELLLDGRLTPPDAGAGDREPAAGAAAGRG